MNDINKAAQSAVKALEICQKEEYQRMINVENQIKWCSYYIYGVDLNKLDKLSSFIKPIEHRLEVKTMQGVKIIDDGFNSNEVGFKKAIDVLTLMKEEKYIITPGIIEQGNNSEMANYELGKYMADKIDFAILVEENARIIKKGLVDNLFEEKKIIVKKDFKEAWEYVKKINSDDKIFLIENDLPSIYLK